MTPPSLRRSLFGSVWSIVAPRRSSRPHQTGADSGSHAGCPFCEGNEAETEKEVFALRAQGSLPDGPGWTIRVVPNKFPALRPDAALIAVTALHEQTAAAGFHEVVIDSPEHGRRLAEFPLAQLEAALRAYRDRVIALSREPGVESVILFRNDGRAAGASQAHPHSQILALPHVPGRLLTEIGRTEQHYQARGRCLTCDMIAADAESGSRLIARDEHFIALSCFAPRFPYESWILPVSHAHDFRASSDAELRSLAGMLTRVLGALDAVAGAPPFNLVLQTSPVRDGRVTRAAFHWRFEILPRLTVPSGLELGTDVFIVAVSPEDAAAALRSHVARAIA